ncbi:MAG: hypothetical protein HZB46_06560 [Solirubrobacterales bacterium]|nr:hypothetical protein [Solirubrobacterales bacterium]
MYDIADAAERARRRRRAGRRPLSLLPEDAGESLVDDLPEDFVALAGDLRALLDAGLVRAQVDPDATVRFGPAPEEPPAA